MAGKILVVILSFILISSGAMLVLKLPPLKLPEIRLSAPNLKDLFQSNPTTPSPTPTTVPTAATPDPSFKVVVVTPKPKLIAPSTACYRYQITHLDGSTSHLCYTQPDYNQLVNLGYELQSAKTFYQFYLDGVARYQQEYDRTASSIYLDAKAAQQQKADAEKLKIDQITNSMYNLEAKGY